MTTKQWISNRIKPIERDKYLNSGKDFIDDHAINALLKNTTEPDPEEIRTILAKSRAIESLSPQETALLLRVQNPDLIKEMEETALAVKKHVYDNRIVTFAPLYMSNKCVNNCHYCSFRKDNNDSKRQVLTLPEVARETQALTGDIGHKRLIVVYGEHPDSDIDYITDTIKTIYDVKVKTRKGMSQIRRANVNAAPMSIEDLKKLKAVGVGTYQVFQETYDRSVFGTVHPKGTLKHDFHWRLYVMHRAFEAGIDDVGIGVLFGLGRWKFDVLSLVYHALELENRYGVGPHTISFPRMVHADNAPISDTHKNLVSDEYFLRAITVLRLAVPYTGMIITAREDAKIRNASIPLGITQTDASSKIGLGAYHKGKDIQEAKRQQFILGDTRSLDEVVRDLAKMGHITSFCTAGYRCGRTGTAIMGMLKNGKEGCLCKLNAVITYREWLDDFASDETIAIAEKVIKKEIKEIKRVYPEAFDMFMKSYVKTENGERDIFF